MLDAVAGDLLPVYSGPLGRRRTPVVHGHLHDHARLSPHRLHRAPAVSTASGRTRVAAADDLEPLLTLDELAAYLGLPKQTLYDWRVNGRGPRAYRISKHLRFTVRDIRAWVDAQHEPAPATPQGG